MTAITKGDLY